MGGVTKHALSSASPNTLAASSSSSSVVALAGEEATELSVVQNNTAGESSADTREHGEKRPHLWLLALVLL